MTTQAKKSQEDKTQEKAEKPKLNKDGLVPGQQVSFSDIQKLRAKKASKKED